MRRDQGTAQPTRTAAPNETLLAAHSTHNTHCTVHLNSVLSQGCVEARVLSNDQATSYCNATPPRRQHTNMDSIYTVDSLTVTLQTSNENWHESTRISFHPGYEVHSTAMSRDACAAYVDSLGPDWCSLASRQQTTTNQRIMSNQTQRRPAVDSWTRCCRRWGHRKPLASYGAALCRAMRVMPLGLQRPGGCATLPKGGPRLCYLCCIATRGSACAKQPTLLPHSRAEDLCHKTLGSRPPSGGGDRPRTGRAGICCWDNSGRQPRQPGPRP